jgi:hypothetical protein
MKSILSRPVIKTREEMAGGEEHGTHVSHVRPGHGNNWFMIIECLVQVCTKTDFEQPRRKRRRQSPVLTKKVLLNSLHGTCSANCLCRPYNIVSLVIVHHFTTLVGRKSSTRNKKHRFFMISVMYRTAKARRFTE